MASKPPEQPEPKPDEDNEVDPSHDANDVPDANTDPWIDGP